MDYWRMVAASRTCYVIVERRNFFDGEFGVFAAESAKLVSSSAYLGVLISERNDEDPSAALPLSLAAVPLRPFLLLMCLPTAAAILIVGILMLNASRMIGCYGYATMRGLKTLSFGESIDYSTELIKMLSASAAPDA